MHTVFCALLLCCMEKSYAVMDLPFMVSELPLSKNKLSEDARRNIIILLFIFLFFATRMPVIMTTLKTKLLMLLAGEIIILQHNFYPIIWTHRCHSGHKVYYRLHYTVFKLGKIRGRP